MAPTLPFNFRMAGSNPMVVADDRKVEILLDPYTSKDVAAFAVRHACNVFFRVDEVPVPLGGGVTIATSLPGYHGASIEAMRLTPSGGVRVPGVFQALAYSNLAPTHETSTPTVPPSARALNAAYLSLSNLITQQIADAASQPGTLLAADAAGGGAQGGDQLPNGVVAGPVVCSDLHVVDGGRIVATNYANLPADYASASAVLPASALALRTAVSDLSNWIVDAAPGWWRLRGAGASGGAGSYVAPPFATGSFLLSTDGQPRFRFEANGAARMAAYGPSNAAPLFAWTNSLDDTAAMALSAGGDLAVRGGLTAGGRPLAAGVTSDLAYAAADASNVAVSAAAFAALAARVAALEAALAAA